MPIWPPTKRGSWASVSKAFEAVGNSTVIDGLLITTGEGAQCFRQDEGDEEVGDGQEELLLLAALL